MKPSDVKRTAAGLLENHCSFALGAHPSALEMLPQSKELALVAGDGMGGCIYEWRRFGPAGSAPMVYLTQYGETSRIAASFKEALEFVVAFPSYWGDVLVAAHKSAELLASVVERGEKNMDAEGAQVRAALCKQLGLVTTSASARVLAAVSASPSFAPQLKTVDGPTPPGSFARRPYPR